MRGVRKALSLTLFGAMVLLTACVRINQPPVAVISSPADGASFTQGESITFTGSATDLEDGALTGASLVWASSIDGEIGTGESFTRSDLSEGTHIITLAATDSLGVAGTASATITVTVSNEPPTVAITAPLDGASFTQGDFIAFTGTAMDPEDGALTGASLVWSSSINGEIGTGESFSKNDLSAGDHTINLTATDSHGATATDSVTITVTVASINRCHVTSIPDSGGLIVIQVPDFCRESFCTVLVSWEGPNLGAFYPGLFWPVDVYQNADGSWISGPAADIGGISITDGSGVNGNGVSEAVVGGGTTVSGNYFRLHDDYPGVENDPDWWTFELSNSSVVDRFANVKVYICPGLDVLPESSGLE